MSSDEDYMSDTFLKKCVDVCPGLVRSHKIQRDNEVKAKKAKIDQEYKNKAKPTKVLEKEKLEAGLSNAIQSDNKGFAMLAKMGYKTGDAIGKSNQGIVEPIGISLKEGRGGLGRETALKELDEKRKEIMKKRLEQGKSETLSTEEYRKQFSQRHENIKLESELFKSQKACQQLDLDHSIEEPVLPWFWPKYKNKQDEDEEENESSNEDEEKDEDKEKDDDEEKIPEVEYDTSEKLEMLSGFLKATYCYCYLCGIRYKDTTDLIDNCPGPRDLH